MIGQLTGKTELQGSNLIIDVSGVGYQVIVSDQTLKKVVPGIVATFFIVTVVKEDILDLYAFLNIDQKQIFSLLRGVSGVGPRIALSLSDLGATELTRAVQEADTDVFTRIPRVGKTLAQKIIIELKRKLGSLKELELGEISDPKQLEVFQALQSLGFNEANIYQVLPDLNPDLSAGDQVKLAIRKLSAH